ncbi:hypothetical protein BJP06_06260 [Corynebacterium sp. NML120713]|nr:hypothetical protein BJP06_06260 [Corynebacterium sp. NML120713]
MASDHYYEEIGHDHLVFLMQAISPRTLELLYELSPAEATWLANRMKNSSITIELGEYDED